MKSNSKWNRNFLRFTIVFFALVSQPSFAGVNLTYRVEGFSVRAHELMGDHGENELYKVPMNHVSDYLPQKESIKRRGVKLIAKRLLPGKSLVKLVHHVILMPNKNERSVSPKAFFGGLPEGIPHTYAIVRNKLIFTETTAFPEQEKYVDRFSKHFLITGCSKYVNFAGEFNVIKNKETDEVFVVFDNASGTYKPKSEHLVNLKNLFDANFSDEGLYFVTKAYGQKISRKQLLEEKTIVSLVEKE